MSTQLHPKLNQLNALFKEIQSDKATHPESKLGHYLTVGSILNAYREGDLTFEECHELLEVKQGKLEPPTKDIGRSLRSEMGGGVPQNVITPRYGID